MDVKTGRQERTPPRVHPVAALFPMMSDEELDDLAEDIKTNGLIHPIVRDADEQIVDGRNREEACYRADIAPTFEELNGRDPVAFIWSANMERRQMNAAQKAMVAARMARDFKKSLRSMAIDGGPSISRITLAATVLDYAPEMADNITAGLESLDRAYEVAKRRKADLESSQQREQLRARELAQLRKADAKLAQLVTDKELSLSEAQAALAKRQEDDRSERRALSADIAAALFSFDDGARVSIEERAQHLMRVDPRLVNGYPADFSAERIHGVVAVLSTWLRLLDEQEQRGHGNGREESKAAQSAVRS